MYLLIFKPLGDRLIAFFLLIISLPLIILISFTQLIFIRGSILFIQQRAGYRSGLFRLIKFKTMNDFFKSERDLLSDGFRIPFYGRILRASSLDELPQLLNVLKGEMSLVGPRPLLPEYLSLYSERQKLRHAVKPGITGWAQVNGRNAISWSEKLELDVWYVEHQNFWLDLKILFLTIWKVISAQGITSASSVTTEKFNGKN